MKNLEQLGISPAPRTIEHDKHEPHAVMSALGMGIVCDTYYNEPDEHTVPNARLIAAAPKLYEALRKFQEAFDCIRGTAWFMDANFASIMKLNEVQNEAEAALAEAAGEEVCDGQAT